MVTSLTGRCKTNIYPTPHIHVFRFDPNDKDRSMITVEVEDIEYVLFLGLYCSVSIATGDFARFRGMSSTPSSRARECKGKKCANVGCQVLKLENGVIVDVDSSSVEAETFEYRLVSHVYQKCCSNTVCFLSIN